MSSGLISSESGHTTLRIALISSSFLPYIGGVEEHTAALSRELRSRGHQVEVWTVDRGEHLPIQLIDGVKIHYLNTPLPSRSLRGLHAFLRAAPLAWREWMAVYREFRPDVLHVQCFGPNGIYSLALHCRTGAPLAVSSHGETFADDHAVFDRSRLLRAAMSAALKRSVFVTGCSQYVLDDLVARFGHSAGVVVPNGIDPGEPDRLEQGGVVSPPVDHQTILALGRLEAVKGFDILVSEFARARLPHGVRLVIGGDGSRRDELARLVEDLGLCDRVLLPGRLDRTQVVRAMSESLVLVVPSRVEAFGIVVLEAWRSGTPVVASNRGGLASLLTHLHDGLLVDVGCEGDLAEALTRIVADEELRRRLVENGLRSVASYRWSAVADQYLRLYQRGVVDRIDSSRRQESVLGRAARWCGR